MASVTKALAHHKTGSPTPFGLQGGYCSDLSRRRSSSLTRGVIGRPGPWTLSFAWMMMFAEGG